MDARGWFPQITSQNNQSLAVGVGYSTTHRVHVHALVACVHMCPYACICMCALCTRACPVHTCVCVHMQVTPCTHVCSHL